MTYKLALKLKEAGFRQRGDGKHYCWPQYEALKNIQYVSCDCDHAVEQVYFPTLSELIDACGERFYLLISSSRIGGWMATDGAGHKGECSTPEEAVANLWLELNINKKWPQSTKES